MLGEGVTSDKVIAVKFHEGPETHMMPLWLNIRDTILQRQCHIMSN